MAPIEERVTLLRPPEPDPNKAPIENALEVTQLGVIGPVGFSLLSLGPLRPPTL
jgi:hypothetical protein